MPSDGMMRFKGGAGGDIRHRFVCLPRHAYANFEKWEDHSIFSVADGFAHSINNVFIRIMRDLVRYYIAQSGEEKLLSAARDNPEREAFLRRFIDQESKVYLSRFCRTYHGLSPDEALATVAHRTRPFAKRLAVGSLILFLLSPGAGAANAQRSRSVGKSRRGHGAGRDRRNGQTRRRARACRRDGNAERRSLSSASARPRGGARRNCRAARQRDPRPDPSPGHARGACRCRLACAG